MLCLNRGTVLAEDKNTLGRLLVSAWLVSAGSGRKVVSESNLSLIIILKITPTGGHPPDPSSLNMPSVKMLTECYINHVTGWLHGTAPWAGTYG